MSTAISAKAYDSAAIGVSGLCIIHCLALPLLAAALPIAGTLAEAEWLHRAFVLVAVPVSAAAIFQHLKSKGGFVFPLLAILGLALLFAGAFVERFHDFETALTVIGALVLAFAHLLRWASHNTPKYTKEDQE